jgi:hypothetical protein
MDDLAGNPMGIATKERPLTIAICPNVREAI